jgi:hypothetical protein
VCKNEGANPGNSPGNLLRVLKERRIVAHLEPRPRPELSFLFRFSYLFPPGLRPLLSAFSPPPAGIAAAAATMNANQANNDVAVFKIEFYALDNLIT